MKSNCFVGYVAGMSSLVERLRVRSDSRPRYSLDDSDDESDILLGKSKNAEQFEKINRDDAVIFFNFIFLDTNFIMFCKSEAKRS